MPTGGPESLQSLTTQLGSNVKPATVDDALGADVIILAIPNDGVAAFAQSRRDWAGKIIVDATNGHKAPPESLGRLSTDIVVGPFPGAKVVKAFNYLPARVLERDPQVDDGGRRVMFIAGNDDGANAKVEALVRDLGFAPSVLVT